MAESDGGWQTADGGAMSSLPAPIARVYALIPLAIRDRIRAIKRPWWSLFIAALHRAARGRAFSGPFRGLVLGKTYYPPTLVGSYEQELHPWLDRVFAKSFTNVVDVGGGTGYYAVGLALRLPLAKVTVFELTEPARAVIADLARRNGVENRLTILGECTPSTFESAFSNREPAFVLMDVEGAEKTLLDPAAMPSLRTATILVETHDLLVPGCHAAITSRFNATHAIEEVSNRSRSLEDFPATLAPGWRARFPQFALESMDEFRGGKQIFMLLTPKETS